MSAGELPPLAPYWPETAIVEMSTANRKPVRDCLIVDSAGRRVLIGPFSRANRSLVKSGFCSNEEFSCLLLDYCASHSTRFTDSPNASRSQQFLAGRTMRLRRPARWWPEHAAMRAPHSRAPQSARKQDRECCGHNHEIEPRAVKAEIDDGNKEQRKHENPRYSCDRCYQLKSPVEVRFRVSPFTLRSKVKIDCISICRNA